MRLPQISLESQFGRIGLNINKPVQEIEQPAADLSIEQKPAELIINRRAGKLTIDQTAARENLDLKSIFRRNEESAQLGYQAVMEYIAKESQEGDEIMNLANKGNPIVDQAVRSMFRETSFNTGNVPSQQSVKINYEPAEISLDWIPNKPNIQVQLNKPIHNYTPGPVEVSMQQYPSLKINFI